jgi:UDP-N-acetylmuramyl pentapeptide phosphotransferase/UDP-N-acetylglucosamine-1-phosphate transferase
LFLFFGFLIVYLIIPVIINVVKLKRLFEKVSDRSSHSMPTPSFGGVAFFIVIILSLSFAGQIYAGNQVLALLPGVIVVFFTGLKDDMTGTKPTTKIYAQLIAGISLLLYSQFNIVDLKGFLAIFEISEWIMIPLGLLIIVFFINAFNLIDGIDGLASLIGIVIFLFYAVIFMLVGDWLMLSVSLSLIGAFIAFLRYNFSRKGKKIFLGDTGSLLIGFTIISFVFYIMAKEYSTQLTFIVPAQNLPIILIALLFVPIYDALRIFIDRISKGRSPFSADRGHMHHLVLDRYGFSHRRTSFVIAILNVLLVLTMTVVCHYNSQIISALVFALIITFISLFLFAMAKKIDK